VRVREQEQIERHRERVREGEGRRETVTRDQHKLGFLNSCKDRHKEEKT
jgi:hypothetical protein